MTNQSIRGAIERLKNEIEIHKLNTLSPGLGRFLNDIQTLITYAEEYQKGIIKSDEHTVLLPRSLWEYLWYRSEKYQALKKRCGDVEGIIEKINNSDLIGTAYRKKILAQAISDMLKKEKR